jgi:hypothetical protein
MSAIVMLWPTEPHPGSGFADDYALCSNAPTFDLARHQLLTALRRLQDAAGLVVNDDGWGSHILTLRPSLVLAAKGAWIVRPQRSEERVGRTLGMLLEDQRRGAAAMRRAVSQPFPSSVTSLTASIAVPTSSEVAHRSYRSVPQGIKR